MDVFEAIANRRSIRSYEDKPVEEEKLVSLLEAARLAPSAKNRQNWKFIVIKDKSIIEKLVPACNSQRFIAQAPVIIAGVADPSFKWYKLDMGIALEHVALHALELGLGTCWIGAFDEEKVSRILNVPDNLETVILITVGYPKTTPGPTPRKSMKKIVRSDSYSLNANSD